MFDGSFLDAPERLTDVTLTVVGVPTATSIQVSVNVTCDGTPVSGLTAGDFIKYTTAGTTQVISTVTETSDGVYTLAGTGFTSGTVTLDAPATLSVQAYEAVAPVTVTIA